MCSKERGDLSNFVNYVLRWYTCPRVTNARRALACLAILCYRKNGSKN